MSSVVIIMADRTPGSLSCFILLTTMSPLKSYYTTLGLGYMIIIDYLLMGYTPNPIISKILWAYHIPFLLELGYYNECANASQILMFLE